MKTYKKILWIIGVFFPVVYSVVILWNYQTLDIITQWVLVLVILVYGTAFWVDY